MWPTLVTLWLALSGKTPSRPAPRRRPAFRRPLRPRRPQLEILEDRTVLSPYVVTTTADSGPGSLRDAINQVNADSSLALYTSPSSPSQDEIDFNISTSDPGYNPTTGAFTIAPVTPLPYIQNATIIDGYSQAGAKKNDRLGVGQLAVAPGDPSLYGDNAVLKVELSGANITTDYYEIVGHTTGLAINYSSCVVEGLDINRWPIGISLSGTNNIIQGNFIGTDVTGTTTFSGTFGGYVPTAGIYVVGGNQQIGGTTPDARNVISGGWNRGIDSSIFYGAGTVTTVQGNFIGTDATGTHTFDASGQPLGSYIGVLAGGVSMVIGGSAPGAGNLISGNTYGIDTQGSNYPVTLQIQGNFIGTDVTGMYRVGLSSQWFGNYLAGIQLQRRTGIDVSVQGGITGNLISGNSNFAATVDLPATLQGNYVGTDVTGTARLHNQYGLALGASNNTVSDNLFAGHDGNGPILGLGVGWPLGTAASSGSVIGGNHFFDNPGEVGLRLGAYTSGNTVRDNDFTGEYSAIVVQSAQNQITGNTIHGSPAFGISVQGGQNTISQNSIYDNGHDGIFLANAANPGEYYDSSFPDGNNDQAAPVLAAAYAASGTTIVIGTMAGTAGSNYHLEFFANTAGDPEGRTFLGSADVGGNTSFVAPLSVVLSAGQGLVTATATDPGGNTSQFSGGITATPLPPSSLSGVVWEDFNNDGQVDFGENGIGGVTITLTGTDMFGNAVNVPQTTDGSGAYVFGNLYPGNYVITETQPAGYGQGIDPVGTAGGSLSGTDQFSVALGIGVDGLNYNFGEQPPAGSGVKHGQTAGVGFWNNKNGQALIKALNGGTGHQLADWLAATLPNTFGARAGGNNLAGQSNAYVAALFQQDFVMKGVKLDAQLLATALSVYATSATLDPTKVAATYGFTVSGDGAGTATINVGSNGDAFGAANNSTLTLMDLLLAADAQAVNGLLYNGNTTRRNEANNVFSAANQDGDIR